MSANPTIASILAGALTLSATAADLPPELAALKWVESDARDLTISYPEKWSARKAPTPETLFYAIGPTLEELIVAIASQPELSKIPESKRQSAVCESMSKASKRPHPGTTVFSCEETKMGKLTGMLTLSDVDHTQGNVTVRMRTMSFALVKGTDVYTIICRCAPDQFEANLPAFGVVFQNLAFAR